MRKMIFITGFARGGTSWLRDCIAFHPDVAQIPREMVVFRDYNDRETIEKLMDEAILENGLNAPFYVNKAPANAPHIGKACRLFPEAKFIYIIRDPRDVFISHKRGNKKWMGGKNSTVEGCMKKIEKYYDGYLDANGCDNLLLIKYEELHQDFHATMQRIYQFIGIPYDLKIIRENFKTNNFVAITKRRVEDRNSAKRKGVVGDWINYLSEDEARWYKNNGFWVDFINTYGYRWDPPTYHSILVAMKEAGVNNLSEDDLLALKLDPEAPNVLLLHDMDLLKTEEARQSALDTAKIEGEMGIASIYNFLPLDDRRYNGFNENDIIEFIGKIQSLSPQAAIGLHLNATEPFFPIGMEDVGDDHPDMTKAVAYLHRQIDDYNRHGINFRVATAHGYGRGKKLPNNLYSPVFTEEIEKRGVKLFDNTLRFAIDRKACFTVRMKDVGGPLIIKDMPNNGAVDDPETYRKFPPNSLIRFLTHPGNYNVQKPFTLGLRINMIT